MAQRRSSSVWTTGRATVASKGRTVHLTPEQIDRQPFRMRRRGYDIVQVRGFLREIAEEMRDRQQVRDDLARDGDPRVLAEREAKAIIEDAHKQAEQIVSTDAPDADAAARVDAESIVADAQGEADVIVAEARTEAEQIVTAGEEQARARADAVLGDAQTRLDALLDEERALQDRVRALRSEVSLLDPETVGTAIAGPADDGPTIVLDDSLASFMKDKLRVEVPGRS